MSLDFGAGVSRTLEALRRQFSHVIWQKGKPPLDSELNLISQLHEESNRNMIHSIMPSGFLMDPTQALDDYDFNPLWSNRFVLGKQKTGETDPIIWAIVNGWVLPIVGTDITNNVDTFNVVKLYPPPASDTRADLVFLEVWQTSVAPNPSTINKPSASTIWKYGNVQYGGTNISDDLQDPTIGFETTQRIQIQYRIRVFGSGAGLGSGVALDVYPDGLTDPNVLGQGTYTSPVAGMTFSNMREALGDPSLWRAGDGDPNNDLGTVDGYVYAIPIAAVFRRNANTFTAVTTSGNPNQNGAFNRNPSAASLPDPLDGSKILTQATLVSALSATATGVIQVNNLVGSGIDDGSHTIANLFLKIDEEIIGISAIDTVASTITIPVALGRGRWGTDAVGHAAGANVEFFNNRPSGLFADEIAEQDILDLRRSVNPDRWDHERLLLHNLAALAENRLRSTWKQSGAGDTEGVTITEVDYLFADGGTGVPNHTEELDGPDGIRTIFSDSATMQPGVTVLCDNDAPLTNGFTTTQFDATAAWDVGADFRPTGFVNNNGASGSFSDGSTIFLHIGGEGGGEGGRATFRDGNTRAVRFVSPKELWKGDDNDPLLGFQHPFQLRFLAQPSMSPAAPGEAAATADKHPGPMYPWKELNFEYPFIVLGGLVHTNLAVSGIAANTDLYNVSLPDQQFEIDLGVNFETANAWFKKDANGKFLNDPTQVANPLVRGQKTLFGMLTNDGQDMTGGSSELYLILYGDSVGSIYNNGAFRIVGAGTSVAGITSQPATTATRVRVVPLTAGFTQFDTASAGTLAGEVRSFITNAEDGGGKTTGPAALSVTFTDLTGIVSPSAKATVTMNTPVDGETLTIDVTAFTAKNVPVAATDFLIGGSDAATATNLAAVINANLSATVTASVSGAVVTVTSVEPGTVGNEMTFNPSNPATMIVSSVFLTGGANINSTSKHPWHADLLGDPTSPGGSADLKIAAPGDTVSDKLLLSSTLLYHPGRGGTARIPTDILRFSIVGPGSEYLRQAKGSIDSSFPAQSGMPSNEAHFENHHIQVWNRLGSLGLDAPQAPGYGGVVVGFSEQDREAELFVDKGSKTILFRPFQKEQLTLQAILTQASPSLLGDATYAVGSPLVGVSKDAAGLFTANKLMAYPIPPEFMPRFGRQDIPHYNDITIADDAAVTVPPFLEGINHLFRDDPDPTKPAFEIIGGEDNISGGNQVKPFFFQTGSGTYGSFSTSIGAVLNKPTYTARRTAEIGVLTADAKTITEALNAVHSSDLGAGLKGIQLPPWLGIARLYGVYDRADYIANGGATWKANRTKLEAAPRATNLLKYGQSRQTLFIMQNGAKDLTTEDGDHTYIIPSECIDFTKSPNYIAGDTFDSYEYVVECVVFGFAKNWINENNFVLSRLHNGAGTLRDELTQPLLEDIEMVIPAPASLNDQTYLAYDRIVYQGDPYMTRNGETRVTSDYEHRYGQIPVSSASELVNPIQQFNSSGVSNIETPNARAYEVLAAVDFYTTMGTGNVGGRLYPGTILDVGFTENTALSATRIPESSVTPAWRVLTRAFSEGQKNETSRARATLEFLQVDPLLEDAEIRITSAQGVETVMIAKSEANYVSTTEDQFLLDYLMETTATLNFGNIAAGAKEDLTATIYGAAVGDTVVVNPQSSGILEDGIVLQAFVSAADTVTVRATNATSGAIDPASQDFYIKVFPSSTRTQGSVSHHDILINTARNLATRINAHISLKGVVTATHDGARVMLEASNVGSLGNSVSVEINTGGSGTIITDYIKVEAARSDAQSPWAKRTKTNLVGGIDEPVNAGSGTSQVNLTGMTERFPLGILLQDSDFLGENPLNDKASAVKTSPAGLRPIQTLLPFTNEGQEYTRFLGSPGELVGMSDGKILGYSAYHATDRPAGTKRYRLFRGGGACFVLGGKNPGGPIDWVSDSFSAPLKPVLKGGILACKALLVRDYVEDAFSTVTRVSEGDEIYMILITHGIFGNGDTQESGISIEGVISPTGYGEGYAAADRYRLNGKPMFKDHSRQVVDPTTVDLAVFTGE